VRGAIPDQVTRLRRGPRPPDAVIRTLQAALAAELTGLGVHHDAKLTAGGVVELGRKWVAAARAAVTAVVRAARRGVLGALPPGPVRAAAETTPAPTTSEVRETARNLTTVVERALNTTGATAAAAAIEQEILQEHARQVRALAVAAGAGEYVWTTRLDERVRHGHALLEGTVQRWSTPPVTDPRTGYRAHPGEPKNCRCVAYPRVVRR
jgi:hypothetical protein